jgi:hypothetical protein
MREIGFLLRIEDANPLADKKYLSERLLDEKGTFLMLDIKTTEPMARNWTLINELRRKLR